MEDDSPGDNNRDETAKWTFWDNRIQNFANNFEQY